MISLDGYCTLAKLRPAVAELARAVAEEQVDSPPRRYVAELEHEILELLREGEVSSVEEWDEEGSAQAAEQTWAVRTGR